MIVAPFCDEMGFLPRNRVELHANELCARRRPSANLDFPTCSGLYRNVLSLLADYECVIGWSTITRRKLKERVPSSGKPAPARPGIPAREDRCDDPTSKRSARSRIVDLGADRFETQAIAAGRQLPNIRSNAMRPSSSVEENSS